VREERRQRQVGKVEPTRDWFPISFISTFAGFADMVKGNESQWGSLSCGCHPNCGVGTAMMINKDTTPGMAPVPALPRCRPTHQGRHRHHRRGSRQKFSNFMMAMALLKNYSLSGTQGPHARRSVQEIRTRRGRSPKRSTVKYGRTSPDRTYEDAMKRRQTDP